MIEGGVDFLRPLLFHAYSICLQFTGESTQQNVL